MLKGLALGSAFLGLVAMGATASAQPGSRDPLNGQFGLVEVALSPAEAAADVGRIADALSKLPAQRPGVVDTYVLSVSFWNEPVFEREAKEAAAILGRRFDATDRTVVLSAGQGGNKARVYPTASANNFNAALGRFASVIDPNEDLVVVFFTSHGGPDGAVAMQEKGRSGGALRPTHLRNSLMQAGIRNKVVIVSACYSGNFILPFSNPETVVLTAAAADKTSFGCEPSREWTYFGDALFNYALRGGAPLVEAFDQSLTYITKWENDLRAQWLAKSPTMRQRDPEPLPSNPQREAGEAALAVVAKAESYGNAVACAAHLSFALDRARTGRPIKGFADVAALTSAQSAAQNRATTEGESRGRSAQDTARTITASAATALTLFPAQTAAITTHIERCMAP